VPATTSDDEPERLEELWRGEFGARYRDRNADVDDARGPFWNDLLSQTRPNSVLEVGCNLGGNLRWVSASVPQTVGIDISLDALQELRRRHVGSAAAVSAARHLPFRNASFDLVFTSGVLIHQPDVSLPNVIDEIVRCARHYVLCAEYYSATPVEVPYRGVDGALFKRDYGQLLSERHPLELVDSGFLDRDAGWDDVTYWLFRK
jgi:spore coat polysaccharide biosynthesis protein SpsF